MRAKQEIVRKAMTRDPKPPPIRMRVNPHDPYSPIARLPGQTYPGDPLVKRPKRPTPGAGGSGRGAFDVNGGAFDVNSKTGINPGINPKTGIPRGQGAQAFYESIEPPTDEELASLGDEVDTPWDEDDDPDDDGPRLVPLPKPKPDPAPREPEPRLTPAPVVTTLDPVGGDAERALPDPERPLPDPALFQRPCPAHHRRPTDPWRCVSPGCPGSHWAHGTSP